MRFIFFIVTAILPIYQASSNELSVQVLDSKGQALEDVVVYARPINGEVKFESNKPPLLIDQHDKKFSPYIVVMQKGQQINFSNRDDITHHIYSVSGDNRFDFKIKAGAEKLTAPMESVEEIAMGCNIHDWMSGYALVVDTPYYGKTDELGKINLNLFSKGEYELVVWHPQLDVKGNRESQTINVNSDKSNVTFSLSKTLLPIPKQIGQDEFDFIEEY